MHFAELILCSSAYFKNTQCSLLGYTVYCCHANTTPTPWCKVLQKLTVAQLVKKFTSLGTWRSITLFKKPTT